MAPRVGRVDLPGERDERRLDAAHVGHVGVREAGRPLALPGLLREVPARQPRLDHVAGLGLQPQLLGEREVRGVERADQLAAALHDAAVVEHRMLDASARAVARLEHEHVGAGRGEVAGRAEPRQPRSEHQHVAAHRSTCA
jgi:hypothetical protein